MNLKLSAILLTYQWNAGLVPPPDSYSLHCGSIVSYNVDTEVAAAISAFTQQTGEIPPHNPGDWQTLRATINSSLAIWRGWDTGNYDQVQTTNFSVTVKDGSKIDLRWYVKRGFETRSAIVYAHGGGMIAGSLDLYDPVVKKYVMESGVPFLAVNYRLAPEARDDSLAQDVFASLKWLVDNCGRLNVDATRIGLMGDSAGGGIAAGCAILARESGIPIARQILIYPMLDDRNLTAIPLLEPFVGWNWDKNFTGWASVLGDKVATHSVSPIVAPARVRDVEGLATAYVEVGELDIFRGESVAYAQRLMSASIPTELHVHPGAPHVFDRLAPASSLARRAFADRLRVIRSL
ncbi:alpha/beta hydrolase [Paraburkholderia tropica]|uniref:alpha/beta hydrolase n=1 Tax=Paraburkholderia tropica TaxID=92647 RepID=UPI002AB6C923|nr:alpha/beta hydrolase [Paraburkholderia tropica]